MANIMQQFRVKNKVSRNGYDLSKRLCFTAKAGELLPTYSRLMMVGDKVEVGNFWETTTAPVNTAAYTRFKEYYEWYFVPLNLLWNKFNTWSTNLKDQTTSATSINGARTLSDDHPYFTTAQIWALIYAMQLEQGNPLKNQFGFNRGTLSAKLLHYLGYGDYEVGSGTYLEDFRLSPWKLLAYQKVCQDWHRNTQWENSAPERYNINYITGSPESLQIPLSDLDLSRQTMFDLNYANWNKDLFMGLLPNAQYGDAASVNLGTLEGSLQLDLGSTTPYSGVFRVNSFDNSEVSSGQNILTNNTAPQGSYTSAVNTRFSSSGSSVTQVISANDVAQLRTALGLTTSSTGTGSINSAFTILALRQAEALQKYKEITQSNPNDFPAQKEAHFGYRPNEAYSERSRLIHSVSNNIEIRPVINQNITENSDSSLNAADIAGYGHGTGNGKPKTFTADVDGVLMCVYHVVPLLDYALPRIDPDNLKTAYTDYAIPEFDKTGMVQVPFAWLTNSTPFSSTNTLTLSSKLLGYAPNYIEYKTDIDEVKGAFYNGGLQAWVAPITKEYLAKYLFKNTAENSNVYTYNGLNFNFFKINPTITDSIFSGQIVDSTTATDKFWVNCYHDVSMVRPLDRDGLPY